MKIAIHDADREHLHKKTFPNYALMKISAYHKSQGDTVEWWTPLLKYDQVYSSKIFDFTEENPYLPECTIRGGTGYPDIPINKALPPEMDAMFPDYSIYPHCDFAIGYITLGCETIGYSLESVLQMNIDKLKARYPDGFDYKHSIYRKTEDV